MIGIKVSILRYVTDDPQPGIVACQFVDANGRHWCFIEKTAVVYAWSESLGPQSRFPIIGFIAGTIGNKVLAKTGDEALEFSTERPWGIESIEGESTFIVRMESLIELPEG